MSISTEDRDTIIRIVYERLSADLYLILQRMGISAERSAQASQALTSRGRIRKDGMRQVENMMSGQWTYGSFPNVGHDARRPEKVTAPRNESKKQNVDIIDQEIRCPSCGSTLLAQATSADDVNGSDTLICQSCRAVHSAQYVVDNTALGRMMAMLQRNNTTSPVSIPDHPWSPKCACEGDLSKALVDPSPSIIEDADLPLEKYIPSTDLNKSLQETLKYILSNAYFDILNYYFEDPQLSESIEPSRIIMLQSAIYDGLMRGENVRQIADRINFVVKDKKRSLLISRTEVARVINTGKAERMQQEGKKKAQWIAAPEDGRRCEECAKRDGKEFNLSWLKKNLPAHPHCRCTFI